MTNLQVNLNEKNSIIKIRDMYNRKQQIEHQIMSNLIFTQALLQKLFVRKHWFVRHVLFFESLKILFFAKFICQRMMFLNWKILIIDCTYKTNKYEMSLCIIFEIIVLNTIFYVVFAFISSKHANSYQWILEQLLELYQELNIVGISTMMIWIKSVYCMI